MKKLLLLAIFFLPFSGFSQVEKNKIPKIDIPKSEIPKVEFPKNIINIDYQKYIINISPSPWNMPIAKAIKPNLYKILVAKPAENLEKILIAKPKNE